MNTLIFCPDNSELMTQAGMVFDRLDNSGMNGSAIGWMNAAIECFISTIKCGGS
jgi:hypothetical protein